MRHMIRAVRCNFPKLFVADEFMGKRNYSINLMLPEGSAALEGLLAAINKSVEERFPGKGPAMVKRFKGSRQSWPIRQLDDGSFSLTAKRKEEQGVPLVLDQRKNILPADKGLPYAGCWVNVSVDVFCYTKNGGGVTCYLNGVQLVREDAPLSGATSAASCRDDFEAIGELAEEDENADLY